MISDKEYKLMGHSLGVNTYHAEMSQSKKDKRLPKSYYRNYFCAGRVDEKSISDDHQLFIDMCKKGLAVRFDKFDNINYMITEKGIVLFEQMFNEKMSKFKTTEY